MNREELAKTFMMTSNFKKTFVAIFFLNQFSALKVNHEV